MQLVATPDTDCYLRTNVSEETLCTWQPWLVCTAPGPPQESLVRDETRISQPATPSLTQTTLGQVYVAPQTSRSRPVTTEPLVAQLALQYSALNHCATWEALTVTFDVDPPFVQGHIIQFLLVTCLGNLFSFCLTC